ncbi:ATP-binding protein [Streptomyces sp. CC208A]|uniref:ATP-binding protein n=1 Tax=Streptomyces sp. CC208A TaxID=3044573 RepID=UPI0024A999CE|nr:ATP-binding protein [Streptomyces sp. CC208A]
MSYRFTGPNLPGLAALARHWVVDLLRQSGWAFLVDRAELCTSELVTNAHQHTASPLITIEVSFAASSVTVCVHDTAPSNTPQIRPTWAAPYALTCEGRGLGLVSVLADEWSAVCDETSKSVWFTLNAPPGGEQPCAPDRRR